MGKAEDIVRGLGGADNIARIEPCATRLRTEVKDPDQVDEGVLKAAGAYGLMKVGSVIQVVVGPEADAIATDIEGLF